MKNLYFAVVQDFTEWKSLPRFAAYVMTCSDSCNIASAFAKNGIVIAQSMTTKKQADAVVAEWNDSYKANGTFAFA